MTKATFVRRLFGANPDIDGYLYRLSSPVQYEAEVPCTDTSEDFCWLCRNTDKYPDLLEADHVVIHVYNIKEESREVRGVTISAADERGGVLGICPVHTYPDPQLTPAEALRRAGYEITTGPTDRQEAAK